MSWIWVFGQGDEQRSYCKLGTANGLRFKEGHRGRTAREHILKVSVFGSGYVGTVSAGALPIMDTKS